MDFSINIESLKPLSHSIPAVSANWELKDYLGAIKVRWSLGRNYYTVAPGLYKIGKPTNESDVFVSANYKLSFDLLRKSLQDIDAWILVLDTKGVNVWCAAGKHTFGTENLIQEIQRTSLDLIVKHRKIIVPQLGAPGVAAHAVKERSGFKVIYGPVRANDIKAFIEAGYRANPEMRRVNFTVSDRAKLIPVDFLYGKYKLLMGLAIIFLLSGIDKTGFRLSNMLTTAIFPMIGIAAGYFAGIVLTPIALPFLPSRIFSVKGALAGILLFIPMFFIFQVDILEYLSILAIGIGLASFVAMNFTGSSTYTSLSGVKKEMKWSIPFQLAFAILGIVFFIISKLK